MANHIRYVYIPIESIRSKDLTPEILDGMDRGEAWELYKKKNSEIVEAGAALVVRFGLKEGQRDERKRLLAAPKVLRHGDPSPLKDITDPNSVLYVHCHGNSDVVGLRPLKLSPALLAARLIEDGLQNIPGITIKLWSCHSGEVSQTTCESFADAFVTAMRARGYYGIKVYGYRGELRANQAPEHKTATVNGESLRARDRRTPAVIT